MGIVGCALASYVVVKRIDDVRAIHFAGSGITFRGKSSANTLSPDEQRDRSRHVEESLEENVHATPAPQEQEAPPVDLSGTWTTLDGMTSWLVSFENGLFVFREQSPAAPGVVSAAGYGTFDGHTWSVQFQTILGTAGTASLELSGDGGLDGEVSVDGNRFQLMLQR